MLQQDYLMNLLAQFFQALLRSRELRREQDDPKRASNLLEGAISNAIEMDGAALLTLSPESIATVMKVSDIDPNVTQFVARSLLLDSVYLNEAGEGSAAELRAAQARAIAAEYGFELPDDPSDFDSITEGLEEAAMAGGFEDQ